MLGISSDLDPPQLPTVQAPVPIFLHDEDLS